MLPPVSRLTRREEFSAVLRRGRRAGRTLLVMHVLIPVGPVDPTDSRPHERVGGGSTRIGLVVSKAVGGSVVRHRVARRLRHVMRDRIDVLPSGTQVVIRALPRSATAESAALGAEMDRALRTVLAAPAAGKSAHR